MTENIAFEGRYGRPWLPARRLRRWFHPSRRNYENGAKKTENFTFEGRYTLGERLMQIPVTLLITAIIVAWGFWMGVIMGY